MKKLGNNKTKPSGNNRRTKREQPRKDSNDRRVNYDNTRISKFDKDMDESGKDPRSTKRTSRSNDVSWYAHNQQLLLSAASVPFSSVTGDLLPHYTGSIPGVMSIEYVPFVGQGDILTQAANQIYSDTVHANSRNQSYDAPDQMMVIVAGANIFSMLALGLRAYGLMRRYEQMDKYTPKALIRASGFDPNDLQMNYSRMWFDLNQLIVQSRQLWIPNVMPLIERWYWMNSNVYMDGSSIKSQYYIFVPEIYFVFSETGDTHGTSLISKQWAPNREDTTGSIPERVMPHSWSEYVSIVQEQINAMIGSQDRGIIFGDILKAYGAEKLYTMSEVTSDFIVEPVYDREVLSQIENATIWGVPDTLFNSFGGITQNNGYIYQNFINISNATTDEWPAATATCTPEEQFLNFHQLENPTPEQVMVATRLKPYGTKLYRRYQQTYFYAVFGPAYAGTEVPVRIRIWRFIQGSDGPVLSLTNMPTRYDANAVISMSTLYQYVAFDWSPALNIVNKVGDIPSTNANVGKTVYDELLYAVMDYDNYTIISAETIKKMHDTAVYSEFGVPSKI